MIGRHAGTARHTAIERRIGTEHTDGRARRATTRMRAARAVIARQGTAIAAALTPGVDLGTPLRATTTAIGCALRREESGDARSGRSSTPTASVPDASTQRGIATSLLLDVIALPLRTAQGLHALVGDVRRVPALADAVADLHAELVGLRADLAGMPADSRRLADDVNAVHGVLGVMNVELADVKASVAPVHGDLARVEAGLAPLPDQLGCLPPKIDELAEQLDGLRTDLSGLPFVSRSS